MHTRENALQKWLGSLNIHPHAKLIPLAGDASFRRYFRLQMNDSSQIIMDAPPEKLSLHPFMHVATQLNQQGFRTPHIYAADHQSGFMLLEDFGDQVFLKKITEKNADAFYRQAIATLANMQHCPTDGLKKFDQDIMLQELTQFDEWFVTQYLAIHLQDQEIALLKGTFRWLATTIAQQPQVFVHRDYHSRNIMILAESKQHLPNLGILDFQDAVCGPWTYDLVSLLKDCYIEWSRDQVVAWAQYFYTLLSKPLAYSFNDFLHDFDLCGLQRHLRVLGTFCRLCFRDNKPNYLNDLPQVFRYVMSCLPNYSELRPFYIWMQQRIEPLFLSRI